MTTTTRAPRPAVNRLAPDPPPDPPRILLEDPAPVPDPALPVPDVFRQLADITTACGPVLSATVTTAIRTIHVHVASPQGFTAWCRRLSTEAAVFGDHEIGGPFVTAATVTEGWTVRVWLYGDRVEDLK